MPRTEPYSIALLTLPPFILAMGLFDLWTALRVGDIGDIEHLNAWSKVVACVILLGYALKHLSPVFPRAFVAFHLAMAAAYAQTYAMSVDPYLGPMPLLHLFIAGHLAFLTAWLVAADAARQIRRLDALVILTGLAGLPALALSWALVDIPLDGLTNRLAGLSWSRPFGDLVATSAAAAAGLAAVAERRGTRTACLLALFPLSAALFWSGGRAGLLALVVALAIGTILSAGLRRILPGVLVAIAAGAALSVFLPGDHPSLQILRRFGEDAVDIVAGTDASSGRLRIWRETLALIAERPWTGHGFFQSAWIIDWQGGTRHRHVHNSILELALAVGVPLALAIVALVAWGWAKAVAMVRQDSATIPAFLTVTCLLVVSLFSGPYIHMEGLIPWALGTGVFMGLAWRAALPAKAIAARGDASQTHTP